MDGPGHIPCSVMVGSGTCLHPAGVGGIQFTMTPCTGSTQTTEIENGDRPHCHFYSSVNAWLLLAACNSHPFAPTPPPLPNRQLPMIPMATTT